MSESEIWVLKNILTGEYVSGGDVHDGNYTKDVHSARKYSSFKEAGLGSFSGLDIPVEVSVEIRGA